MIVLANDVSDFTIKGDGVLDGNKANNTNPSNPARFAPIRWGNNVSSVEIVGITIQNSGGDTIRSFASDGAESSDVTVKNTVQKDSVEGFVWTHTDDVKCLNNTFLNVTEQDAMEPVHCDGFVISKNIVRTAQQSGVDVYNGCKNGTIENNIIIDPAQTAESGIGVGSTSGSLPVEDVDVRGNVVVGSGGISIDVRGYSTAPNRNISITNNRVVGGVSSGIQTGIDATNIDVIGNTVRRVGKNGIAVNANGAVVVSNSVYSPSQTGIRLLANDQTAKDNHIEGSGGSGVYVDGNDVSVDDNDIFGSGGQGIAVSNALVGVDINNNSVRQSSQDGIFHSGNDGSVEGNSCKNNNQGNNTNHAGVRVNGNRVMITDNRCWDDQATVTQDNGIYIQSGSSNCLCSDNMCYYNSENQVWDNSGEATTDVRDNKTFV